MTIILGQSENFLVNGNDSVTVICLDKQIENVEVMVVCIEIWYVRYVKRDGLI